jgi:hypothetical protein
MIPAPRHLMDPWRDALIAELRLREVPGDRIGEALAEVDAHCADSGQTPDEAFGDPVGYARTLVDVHVPGRQKHRLVRVTAQAFATLTGVFSVLNAAEALTADGPAEVTAGQLTAVVLGTATFVVVIKAVFTSAVYHRTWAFACVVMAGLLTPALPVTLWRTPVAEVPAWALFAAGLFLLAAAWWPAASERLLGDRIIDPRTGTEPFPVPRLLSLAIRWMLPGTLLVAVLLIVLFR